MQSIDYKTPLLLSIVLCLLAGCTTMTKHYSEIGTPNLDRIAVIRTDRANSSVVIYNSEICREIGDACGFFRSHAYAHVPLNHRPFLPNYPDAMENDADCWAAQHADQREVVAAVRLLSDEERIRDLPITGDPADRARRIKDCAVEAANWPEGA